MEDKTLTTCVAKISKDMKEMKNEMIGWMMKEGIDFNDTEPEKFRLMFRCLSLFDNSLEVMEMQAKVMEDTNAAVKRIERKLGNISVKR